MQHVIEHTINAQKLWAIDETGIAENQEYLASFSRFTWIDVHWHLLILLKGHGQAEINSH